MQKEQSLWIIDRFFASQKGFAHARPHQGKIPIDGTRLERLTRNVTTSYLLPGCGKNHVTFIRGFHVAV